MCCPREGIVTDEISQMGFTAWYAYPVYQPRTFISSGYQGTLGFGVPDRAGREGRQSAPTGGGDLR